MGAICRILKSMRRLAIGCALLSACSFTPGSLATGDATATTDASDGSMTDDAPGDGTPMQVGPHVRPISIAGTVTGGPHVNFPLLVLLEESWLAHTSAIGEVTSVAAHDVTFSADAAGTVPLAHEVEDYNETTGRYRAWVKLPSLEQSTVFYIRYGDATITASQENVAAVWSPIYAAVWHLAPSLADSAGTATGTNAGSLDANGKIGAARSFDSVDDVIDLTLVAAIDNVFGGGGTIEAWFLATTAGEMDRGRIFEKSAFTTGGGIDGWALHMDSGSTSGSIRFAHSTTTGIAIWNTGTNTITTGTWHHVAVVYNKDNSANTPLLVVDGVDMALSGSTPGGTVHSDAAHTLRLGNRANLDRSYHGSIDEARISTASHSISWIKTSYANQNNFETYCTAGAEIPAP